MQCPNLRRIQFGNDYYCDSPDEGGSWVVHLEPVDQGSINNPIFIDRIDGDMLGIMTEVPEAEHSDPWSATETIGRYVIRTRWNMQTAVPDEVSQEGMKAWWRYIKAEARFKNLHKFINLEGIEVIDMDDLVDLYEVQSHRTLERIYAQSILPYQVNDFERFAKIASSTLSVPRLAWEYEAKQIIISFLDLPNMMFIVRQHLPKLEELYFSLNGVRDAEVFMASAC